MSARTNALASRFEAANRAMIDAIAGAPAEALGGVTDDEGWTVVAVGAHVAAQHDFLVERARRIVTGEENPPFDAVAFHEENRRSAAANANLSRDDAIARLREHGSAAAAFLRGLDDADLDRTKSIPAMGEQPVSAQTFVEMVLIGHTEAHLTSLRESLG
jgi:hypothetical protein